MKLLKRTLQTLKQVTNAKRLENSISFRQSKIRDFHASIKTSFMDRVWKLRCPGGRPVVTDDLDDMDAVGSAESATTVVVPHAPAVPIAPLLAHAPMVPATPCKYALMIDGGHLYHSVERAFKGDSVNWTADYRKVIRMLENSIKARGPQHVLVRTEVHDCFDLPRGRKDRWKNARLGRQVKFLDDMGVEVPRGYTMKRNSEGKWVQSGVDAGISLAMGMLPPDIDRIVLVATDKDFAPMIQRLRAARPTLCIYVVTIGNQISKELESACAPQKPTHIDTIQPLSIKWADFLKRC
jgi:uncharacterized LabA/DUF88 family protein